MTDGKRKALSAQVQRPHRSPTLAFPHAGQMRKNCEQVADEAQNVERSCGVSGLTNNGVSLVNRDSALREARNIMVFGLA